MRPKQPVEKRFWAKVDKVSSPNGCWLWTGDKSFGYGRFFTGRKTRMMAHRFSYELHYGPIPDGMNILHVCDNPSCVNPTHLKPGTQKENIADMYHKYRNPDRRGEKCYRHKLTTEQALEIRRLYATGEYTQKQLADMFNVTRSNISLIIRRINWTNI